MLTYKTLEELMCTESSSMIDKRLESFEPVGYFKLHGLDVVISSELDTDIEIATESLKYIIPYRFDEICREEALASRSNASVVSSSLDNCDVRTCGPHVFRSVNYVKALYNLLGRNYFKLSLIYELCDILQVTGTYLGIPYRKYPVVSQYGGTLFKTPLVDELPKMFTRFIGELCNIASVGVNKDAVLAASVLHFVINTTKVFDKHNDLLSNLTTQYFLESSGFNNTYYMCIAQAVKENSARINKALGDSLSIVDIAGNKCYDISPYVSVFMFVLKRAVEINNKDMFYLPKDELEVMLEFLEKGSSLHVPESNAVLSLARKGYLKREESGYYCLA